jgi:threonine dehydrogenase-like Zn-dependent dehydrogenase
MTERAPPRNEALVLHALPPQKSPELSPTEGRVTRLPRYRKPLLRREVRPVSARPEAGWIRVQPAFVGICGSDLHLLEATPPDDEIRFSAPLLIGPNGRVIGHEGIARVTCVSPEVEGFDVGDWVVPASVHHCGQCPACEGGHPNQCATATLLGAEVDGLFADQADLDSRLLTNVTGYVRDTADLIALAALEPSSTALQACEAAGLSHESRLVIFGAGPIGAFCAMIAKEIFQCAHVSVVEPAERRRDLVRQWADQSYASVSDLLANSASTHGFNGVIEASGHLENINQIFTRIGSNGNVVVLARSGEPMILNHVDHMITKAITIQGCRGQLGGYMTRVAEWYAQGRLPLEALIEEAGEGLECLAHWLHEPNQVRDNFCKAVIRLNVPPELAG